MEGYPGHLVHQLNAALQVLPSRPHQILTPLRPYTLTQRSPPSRSSPAVAAVLSPVSYPGPSVSSPPDSVAIHRFSSRPHHLFKVSLKVCHRKISQCSPNKNGGRRFYTALLPHTLPHWSPPSRLSLAIVAVLSPISFPWPPVSSTPDSVATRRLSSLPHHLFNVFLKVCHRKIAQCSPNKYGGRQFEYTALTGNFEKSLHLTRTLAARCPNAKFVHTNSLCFMEKRYFSAAVLSVSL